MSDACKCGHVKEWHFPIVFSTDVRGACLNCDCKRFFPVSAAEKKYIVTHHRRYVETLETVARYVPVGGSVLEIGSLFGYITFSLREMGYDVATTDIACEVEKHSATFRNAGIENRVCDLNREGLPFENCSFDCVLLTEVIEHIEPSSVTSTISEVRRVLKDGGILIFSTPNVRNLGNILRALIGLQPLTDSHHLREYRLDEVHGFFRDSGIAIIDEWFSMSLDYTHDINPFWKKALKCLLYPIWAVCPKFRTTIYIIGEKKNV